MIRFHPPIRPQVAISVLALFLAVASSAQTIDNKPDVKKEVLDQISTRLMKDAFVPGIDFDQWPTFLSQGRKEVDTANTDDDFQKAVNEALHKFGASHIVLMTPRAEKIRDTGSTVGIGIRSQVVKDGIEVLRVVKNAPADKAGLVAGDIITKVDGKPIDGIVGIPGPEGTTVTVTVRHTGGKEQDYPIVRAKFSTVSAETLEWLDKDTAKLTVFTFDAGYSRDNVENLMKQAHSAKNLVLDLRDNGGGQVLNLEHLLGLLMNPEQPIGTFITSKMFDEFTLDNHGSPTDLEGMALWSSRKVRPMASDQEPYQGHIAVLINQWSGSASEICAAALKEIADAKIIGTKSAGAVLVSVIVPVGNGFMLQYPLMDYVTIRGRRLEGNGVTPDIEAKDPAVWLPNADDPCVKAALAWTKELATGRDDGTD
jgi:carboxyl-terminal processing protease